jgi:hypothetical protein
MPLHAAPGDKRAAPVIRRDDAQLALRPPSSAARISRSRRSTTSLTGGRAAEGVEDRPRLVTSGQ